MEFIPQVGDKIHFISDRQTEKGPSDGSVVIAQGDHIAIRHSDTVQWFKASHLRVKSFRTITDSLRSWTFF